MTRLYASLTSWKGLDVENCCWFWTDPSYQYIIIWLRIRHKGMTVEFMKFENFWDILISLNSDFRQIFQQYHTIWGGLDLMVDPRQVISIWLPYLNLLRLYSRGIGSEGLRPQLIRCAPFPSIAPYFKILYLSYPKIWMAMVVYPKVRTTIIWYPDVETSIVYSSEGKD